MSIEKLADLFRWMTIINVGLLVLSSVLIMMLKRIVCRMHGKLFGVGEDKVAIICYSYLGVYKVLIIVFNIVPYIALLLIQ